jgi:hypothetical protein
MLSVYRCVLSLGLANGCVAARIAAQAIGPHSPDEWNAINVLQGAVRTPIIDSGTLATTAKALRLIRERYPEVRDIPTGPDETVLHLMLSPLLSATVARMNGRPFEPSAGAFNASALDSGALDSLNIVYHVQRLAVQYFFGKYLVYVRFGSPVNVPSVVDQYRDARGVQWASRPTYGRLEGTGSRVQVVIKRPLWHFIFVRGGTVGDTRLYYFTYDARSGGLTPEGDGPEGGIRTKGVPLWQRSGDASLQPYDSYATLIGATADSAWWVRRAAVEVLGFLFEHPNNPWGRDFGDTARYDALKDSAWANQAYVVRVLRRARLDPDEDVQAAAAGALRKAQSAGVMVE